MSNLSRRGPESSDPVKEAMVNTLQRVLDPLLELMFDAGITMQEFNRIARDRAVRTATKRVAKASGRESRSRVAIMTGLPRTEVARILNSRDPLTGTKLGQHPARRVLAAWHDDPRFLEPNGEPSVLAIFGKKLSFEHLVARYGGGIPIRAMLDELVELDAVERLGDQTVRAKVRLPIMTGLSNRSINAVGERGKDLLMTLVHNLHRSLEPFFEATAVVEKEINEDLVELVRREIAKRGSNFVDGAKSILDRAVLNPAKLGAKSYRVGVTAYYFQQELDRSLLSRAQMKNVSRKNLKRR